MEVRKIKKGRIIIFGIFIIIIVVGILAWRYMSGDKIKVVTEEVKNGLLSPLIEEIGVGNGDVNDTFYVKKDSSSGEEFIPGKYILDIEWKKTVEKMTNSIDNETYERHKRHFDYLNLIIYVIKEPEQIQRIDVQKLISKNCLGFQDSGIYLTGLQAGGDLFVGFLLEDIPKKATDKQIYRWLFWNMETEETIVLDGEDAGITFIENGRTEEETEYLEKIEQADWESFYAQNGYRTEGQDRTFFNAEGLWAATGGVKVTVDCEVLPQENDILYTRFPELEKWKGAEDRKAIIWVGGYPTVEEIMAMFERQELQN